MYQWWGQGFKTRERKSCMKNRASRPDLGCQSWRKQDQQVGQRNQPQPCLLVSLTLKKRQSPEPSFQFNGEKYEDAVRGGVKVMRLIEIFPKELSLGQA
jgi:hypothetical protein